ncbi:hypothetical protein PoB_001365600 [Plakobranchus ocellatus]|uniref:Uncharacterized protein n=1 Tax=Plakobranchus ocellatus TaxID=259542 RepID=A0AAV3YUP4_9GAST|nr:hypothetical protein PoB_001365600 [Plakobranchus ocellatus]
MAHVYGCERGRGENAQEGEPGSQSRREQAVCESGYHTGIGSSGATGTTALSNQLGVGGTVASPEICRDPSVAGLSPPPKPLSDGGPKA